MAVWMLSKYRAECRECEAPINVGNKILYGFTGNVLCESCGKEKEEFERQFPSQEKTPDKKRYNI